MRDVSRGEHWFDFVMRRKDAAGNPFLLVGRPGHSYGICCFGGDGHVSLSLSLSLDELCHYAVGNPCSTERRQDANEHLNFLGHEFHLSPKNEIFHRMTPLQTISTLEFDQSMSLCQQMSDIYEGRGLSGPFQSVGT